MSNTKRTFLVFLLMAVTLAACGDQRYGDPVQRDRNGNLPPVAVTRIGDADAELVYQAARPNRWLTDNRELVTKWNEMRRALTGPEPEKAAKRARIGRLIAVARVDRTDLRLPLVQLWAIHYGQRLTGVEAERAEQVLIDRVLTETDLNAAVFLMALNHLVLPNPDMRESGREALDSFDHFFRTGAFPRNEMPKAEDME